MPKRLLMRAFMLTALVVPLVVTACHRSKPSSGLAAADSLIADTSQVVLEVENHNWSDIDIYILHDGRTHRLVTVTATKDVSIPIPAEFQGETGVFRLFVRRIGGTDSYTSDGISVRTGNTIRLTVESTLARSSVGVW
jgi:hypothetical protein